jgi:hypothetical protein
MIRCRSPGCQGLRPRVPWLWASRVRAGVALAYQGISYTTSEKVVDLGPLKVEAKREKTIPMSPVAGVAALVVGVVLVVVSGRR